MLGSHTLTDLVEKAAKNGVTAVQLREKDTPIRECIQIAQELKQVLDPLGVPLIINDRVDVALAVDADGVHLGQMDFPQELARKILGKEKIIGLSAESSQDAELAEQLDVDYLGISPVFTTPTKTDTTTEWGLNGLKEVARKSRHKLVAIGGINSKNAGQVMRHGADGIAVVSAICAANDPALAAKELRKLVDIID